MRPRRHARTEPRTPHAQYHRVHVNRCHPSTPVAQAMLELMAIAQDAKRHGLEVTGIAALPTPRVHAINPLNPQVQV